MLTGKSEWVCVCVCMWPYWCVFVCVCIREGSEWEGVCFILLPRFYPPEPRRQNSVCSISLGGSSTEWHVKHTSPSTWWSLLLSNDKKPLCRLALFLFFFFLSPPRKRKRVDSWASIKESWMLFHRTTGLSVHKYFSSREMCSAGPFFSPCLSPLKHFWLHGTADRHSKNLIT